MDLLFLAVETILLEARGPQRPKMIKCNVVDFDINRYNAVV